MAWNLSVNFNLPGGTRLLYQWRWDEDNSRALIDIELRCSNANGDRVIAKPPQLIITDVQSDQLLRQDVAPAAGGMLTDWQIYFKVVKRATPTGYTDLRAAEKAANNNPAARRTAVEQHLASAGHVDNVSLAGS